MAPLVEVECEVKEQWEDMEPCELNLSKEGRLPPNWELNLFSGGQLAAEFWEPWELALSNDGRPPFLPSSVRISMDFWDASLAMSAIFRSRSTRRAWCLDVLSNVLSMAWFICGKRGCLL